MDSTSLLKLPAKTRPHLRRANVLVVMSPLAVDDDTVGKGVSHFWWSDEGRRSGFTSAERLAVVQWIRAGGSLLLVVDHAPYASACGMPRGRSASAGTPTRRRAG